MSVTFAPPPRPGRRRPITLIGAGGIARDAHLPAYRLAGFVVAAVHDADPTRAAALARDFAIPRVHATVGETVRHAPADTVYDVAVPAPALSEVLTALPDGSPVLIQKPFGESLAEACALRALCRRKGLQAAVNFQLRSAPCIAAARQLLAGGVIGELHDLEVRVTVHMPWQLWPFLAQAPRLEILYHSIHYIDLLRSFLGDPQGIYAKTVKHPLTAHLAATRTTMALDYGDLVRATVTCNHGHDFGPRHQESYVKWEGTRGAMKAGLGLLLNYPVGGGDDTLEYCTRPLETAASPWQAVELAGNWYPHAFIGPMSELMRFANGEAGPPSTHLDDAVRTMAVVEAAYQSSATGATPIPSP